MALDTNSKTDGSEHPAPEARRGIRFSRSLSIRTLLVTAFLISGLIPLTFLSVVGLRTVRVSLKQQTYRHLESIRDLKSVQIRRFFDERRADIQILSTSPEIIRSCMEMGAAFYAGGDSPGDRIRGGKGGNFSASEEYRSVHEMYYPLLKQWAERHQYHDILLLDAHHGDVIFSVRKEADFGQRLGSRDSPLADAWKHAIDGETFLSDTRPYPPSGNMPAQFLAAPLKSPAGLCGVVAVQVSNAAVAAIMSERSGMWPSGETYLVGPDMKMRSDSFLDPSGHSLMASFFGTIRESGVKTEPSILALEGKAGVKQTSNYSQETVISAFAPVNIPGLNWVIIAEVRSSEINRLIASALNSRVLPLLLAALAALAALAMAVSFWIGRSIRKVGGQFEGMINRALKGEITVRGDPLGVGPDFAPVVDGVNRLLDTFCCEIEEKRQLEQQMEFNQRMMAIGSLAGGIAHDFNNLLATLFVNTEIVRRELPVDSPARIRVREMRSALRRGAGLVHQILTFSSPSEKPRVPVSLWSSVQESMKIMDATTPRNVVMEAHAVARDAWVKADPTQVHQILVNLCTNASQSMTPGGGRIEIRVDRVRIPAGRFQELEAGDYCRIRVSDTGPGIPPELRESIFQPFFTTRSKSGGSGLGLSVVKGIVMGLGGQIYLSARRGRGATFEVILPAVSPPLLDWKPPRISESGEKSPGRNILFVDDEVVMARGVAGMLAQAGFKVTTRNDPRAAERIFARRPNAFDAVVADLDMPHIDGLELLERCRRLRKSIPCILISGHTGRIDDERMERIPGLKFLCKPFEISELTEMLISVMNPQKSP